MTRALALAALLAFGPAVVIAHGSEDHAVHDVPAVGAPEITSLRVEKDPSGGWNVFVEVANFRFAPEVLNGPAADDAGYGVLYADGMRVARVYGPAHHLSGLPFGPHEIRFVLASTDHAEFAVAGRPIESVLEINVD